MAERDRRLTPARGNVAASHLKGLVSADRYVTGTPYQITASVLPVRARPEGDGPQDTQGRFGETFTIYDEQDGWGWGQLGRDGYVGYVDMEGLSLPVIPPTHRISALRTYRYVQADLKSAPLGLISMNALITVTDQSGAFVKEARGGWVWAGHTTPLGEASGDPVAVAEMFVGTPYFWGGCESLGLDCSGLMQNAFAAVGRAIPRDADQQEAHFTDPRHGLVTWDGDHPGDWREVPLQRGDVICWPGHIGLMVDAGTMVHANATHMATTRDALVPIADKWEREKGLKVRRMLRPHGQPAPVSAPRTG